MKTKNPELERQRKAHILAKVHDLLAEGSHHTMTLARVAKAAGVSKGMLTYYFASKDEMIIEAIRVFLDNQGQLLEAAAENDAIPVRDRLALLIHLALPDPAVSRRQLQFLVQVWSFASERPEAMELVREAYLRFRRQGEAMLQRGIDAGYVTADDARWVYLVLHALLDGLGFQLAVDPELDAAEVRRKLLELVDGLLSPPA